jgi:hypothetical protein
MTSAAHHQGIIGDYFCCDGRFIGVPFLRIFVTTTSFSIFLGLDH